jgi:hypothetical protein
MSAGLREGGGVFVRVDLLPMAALGREAGGELHIQVSNDMRKGENRNE